MTRSRLLIAALVLALAQIGFLAWMIAGRAAILRDGREVLLKIEPVDPRDLLRGDYVRLGYEIGRIPVEKFANFDASAPNVTGGPVTVRLKQEPDNFWGVASAWIGAAPTPAAPDEADISGTITYASDASPGSFVSVDYGIERFYVPEGEGLPIEQGIRERNFGLKVALSKDGTPQIKALMDGDKMLFQEPLY